MAYNSPVFLSLIWLIEKREKRNKPNQSNLILLNTLYSYLPAAKNTDNGVIDQAIFFFGIGGSSGS